MMIEPETINMVKQALAKGQSAEEITQMLISAGYARVEVAQIMMEAKEGAPSAPIPRAQPSAKPIGSPVAASAAAGGSNMLIFAVIGIVAAAAIGLFFVFGMNSGNGGVDSGITTSLEDRVRKT